MVRGEACEDLRRTMVDVCCLQEVRWRGKDPRMLEMDGRRFQLW